MDIPRILTIVLSVVIALPLLALLAYKIIYRSNKGKYGERQVQVKLNKYIFKRGGFLINDVIVPGNNDKTSEIDHILFTNYGVFVIETKNLSGLIIGKEEDVNWIQVLGIDGRIRNSVYNPVMQNQTHVDRLNKILNINYIYNLVVFVQNNTRKIKSNYVIKRRKLIKYLKSYNNKVFSDQEVTHLYEKIMYYKEHPIISKEEHINRIQEKHNSH